MKTVLLYPYLHTEDDGEDLRLSLRSVDTHLHLGKDRTLQPLVVGDQKPSWLDAGAFRQNDLVWASYYDRDHLLHNMLSNIIAGMRLVEAFKDLDDEFLFMNDDFILLEHRYGVVQTYHNRTDDLWRNVNRTHPSMKWWSNAMNAARLFCERGGCPEPKVYELHVPMWMRASSLPLMEVLADMPIGKTPFPRTVYGNLVGHPDHDVYPGNDPAEVGFIGSSWINLKDQDPKKRREMIQRLLPTPSRWELTR